MSATRFFALVPAAGVGSRSGHAIPKQYVALAGLSLISHTLAALQAVPELDQTLVVLAPEDDRFEAAVPGFSGWTARCGGASRAESVAAGLQALRERGAAPNDWVLVHDAARCLLRPEWVSRLIAECRDDAVGGLLALPLADTLKRAEGMQVQQTVDRRAMWAAQTPQMFRLGLLAQALSQPGEAITDEASAIEALGLSPRLVAAPLENFKLTLPADFELAERLLRTRP
ncbi:2-C-methyl-D-erythritol 4-phosphate cytidylyltransferase [Inhella inkyongensis]|uniref:2-C-methyl-D-erythritol 4-phosphate cytidylyltransferase n=1 Tax=Inhella inkyongensis TaxID=392593 RepID=A0A840S2L3_9BURK|nr:2-C-methyl-D-erythritol 4-phosphate cytidylyltransferase [Inhella inkyongensis]MBB5205437.1 2-C-methyl-D-erythritol 4-phosphate cytidylyltransferase [Inhella inkyongensis]